MMHCGSKAVKGGQYAPASQSSMPKHINKTAISIPYHSTMSETCPSLQPHPLPSYISLDTKPNRHKENNQKVRLKGRRVQYKGVLNTHNVSGMCVCVCGCVKTEREEEFVCVASRASLPHFGFSEEDPQAGPYAVQMTHTQSSSRTVQPQGGKHFQIWRRKWEKDWGAKNLFSLLSLPGMPLAGRAGQSHLEAKRVVHSVCNAARIMLIMV